MHLPGPVQHALQIEPFIFSKVLSFVLFFVLKRKIKYKYINNIIIINNNKLSHFSYPLIFFSKVLSFVQVIIIIVIIKIVRMLIIIIISICLKYVFHEVQIDFENDHRPHKKKDAFGIPHLVIWSLDVANVLNNECYGTKGTLEIYLIRRLTGRGRAREKISQNLP